MSDFLIRPAALSDASGIGRVHCLAWRETYAGLLPDAILARLSEARSTEIFRREGCRNLFAGVLDGEIVGFCGYGPWRGEDSDPGLGEIVGLYVLQKAQHQGIGTRLLHTALAALRDDGCTSVALWVLASNAHAIGYYQAQGFRDTGLTQGEGPLLERKMQMSLSKND